MKYTFHFSRGSQRSQLPGSFFSSSFSTNNVKQDTKSAIAGNTQELEFQLCFCWQCPRSTWIWTILLAHWIINSQQFVTWHLFPTKFWYLNMLHIIKSFLGRSEGNRKWMTEWNFPSYECFRYFCIPNSC